MSGGEEQHPGHANQTQWHCKHNYERVEKGTELKYHDQVNQDNREPKAETERLEGLAHGFDLPARLDEITFGHLRSVVANFLDVFFYVGSHRAEVASAHVDEDVNHARDVQVVDFRRGGRLEQQLGVVAELDHRADQADAVLERRAVDDTVRAA